MTNNKFKNFLNNCALKIKELHALAEKHLGKTLGNIVSVVVIATLTFAAFLLIESIIMGIAVQFWLAAILVVLILK